MLRASIIFWCCVLAQGAQAGVIGARFGDPTDRYDHGILGDAIEWGSLELRTDDGRRLRITLPESRVFEDLEPRLISAVDGRTLVMVVETDIASGARLALYDETGLVAATPYIGRTHRWLAPIGAADLDGDGQLEIAYVDRPHLAKTIKIWRFANGTLTEVGELPGFTNHRIGENTIAGGIRDCGKGPEMLVADSDWRDVYAIRWDGTEFSSVAVTRHKDRSSFADAMACR